MVTLSGIAESKGVASDADRLRLERDLYLGLLELSDRTDKDVFLEEALGLIVQVLGAQQGYLEVFDPDEGPASWRAAGCSNEEVQVIRRMVSHGIIAEAVSKGDVVNIPSAILDPRWRDRPSVQAAGIEAVLCVPILRKTPIGVLYMQGHRGGPTFCSADVERVRSFARHLAPLVESLFVRSRQAKEDPVAPFRKRLAMDGIVGTSTALAKVLREVEMFAPLEVPILVTGETGTGKSQIAQVIHDNGRRRGRPMISFNSANLPDNLVESELFGSVPGAYNGATRREGRVSAAQGGTLFFDEVAELSLDAQRKLLTFLDTRRYSPLGSNNVLTADVRLIAATNVDLDEAVRERRFREDLLYRLRMLPIRMPSLAERPEDLIPLAMHLCEQAVESNRLSRVSLSPGALRAVQAAEWPGNVRQLAGEIGRAAILASSEGSTSVEAHHVFLERASGAPAAAAQLTFQEQTRRFQAGVVQHALEASDWNVAQAARTLDLTRAHLHNLIRAFGLTRPRSS